MGLLIPRNPFAYPGTQPRFDPTHPAARGIVPNSGASVACLGGANLVSLLNGAKFTPNSTPTAAQMTPMGPGVSFLSSGQSCSITGQATTTPSAVTHGVILSFSTSPSGKLFAQSVSGSLGGTGIGWNISSFTLFGKGGNALGTIPYAGIVANRPYFVAGTSNATTTYMVVTDLVTGLITTTTSSPTEVLDTQTGTLMVGNWFLSGADFIGGTIATSMYSTTYLPLSTLQQWAQAPWDFWYPQTAKTIIFASLHHASSAVTGVGSATGSAAVSGVGRSLVAGVGSATGAAAVAGVGRSLGQSVGSSTGTSSVAGVAPTYTSSVGTSTGTSSVSGIGRAVLQAIGTAAGQAAVNGASPGGTIGVATGQASSLGVSSSIILSVGTANGSADVEGIECVPVFSTVSAIGQADGQASVIGISLNVANSVGRADGTSSVLGISKTTLVYTGTANGTSFVQGISNQPAILFPGAILLAGL